MARELNVGITIGASLAASFGSALGRSQRQLAALGGSIARTERRAADIDGYRRLENAVAETRTAQRAARAEADRLQRAMARARNPTDELRRGHADASREAQRLAGELARQNRELGESRREMRRAGVAVERLDREEAALGRTLQRQKRALADTNRLLERREAIASRRSALRGRLFGAATAAVALGGAMHFAVGGAVGFESAMADVGKVVDFPSPTGLVEMGRSLQAMSTRIPIAAEGLAAIVAEAGQANIARGELLRFAADAAKMGVAFDIGAREAGDAMAGLRNIFGLNQDEVIDLVGAYNHLSNNMAARAPDLLNIANRAGSTAKMFGLSGQALGALGGTFLALKTPPEVAGTAINAMLTKLQNADKQTPKFREALDNIGMSADDLKERVGAGAEDAQGALLEFLEAVAGAEDTAGVLFDLFGQEYVDDVTKLVGAMDQYRAAVALARSEQARASSVEEEYLVRAKTTENRLILLGNQWRRMGTNIGAVFLPALNDAAEGVGGVLDKVALFAERNPEATRTIVVVGAALVGLKIAAVGAAYAHTFVASASAVAGLRLLGLRIAALAVGQSFAAGGRRAVAFGAALAALPGRMAALGVAGVASVGIRAVGAAMKSATLATWRFTVALLANPIGWIGLAIAAVAATIVRYWQPIKAFFGGLWAGIREGFGPVGEMFGQLGEMIGALLEPVKMNAEELAAFADAGKTVGLVVGKALRLVVNSVVTMVRVLGGLAATVWKLVNGDFAGAWESAKGVGEAFAEGVKGIGDVFAEDAEPETTAAGPGGKPPPSSGDRTLEREAAAAVPGAVAGGDTVGAVFGAAAPEEQGDRTLEREAAASGRDEAAPASAPEFIAGAYGGLPPTEQNITFNAPLVQVVAPEGVDAESFERDLAPRVRRIVADTIRQAARDARRAEDEGGI